MEIVRYIESCPGPGAMRRGGFAEISESLGQLAKVMKNSGEDPGLSREDGIAALESAASMVCGSCDRCGMKQECLEDQDGENYFLYYLLRSFEKKGRSGISGHAQGSSWTGAGRKRIICGN